MASFVENIKERQYISKVMAVIREEAPLIYAALIGESIRTDSTYNTLAWPCTVA